jgi:hypothetical protein
MEKRNVSYSSYMSTSVPTQIQSFTQRMKAWSEMCFQDVWINDVFKPGLLSFIAQAGIICLVIQLMWKFRIGLTTQTQKKDVSLQEDSKCASQRPRRVRNRVFFASVTNIIFLAALQVLAAIWLHQVNVRSCLACSQCWWSDTEVSTIRATPRHWKDGQRDET